MFGFVPTAVGQVGSADERDVYGRIVAVPDDEHFLVVRSEDAHSLIQQHLARGIFDLVPPRQSVHQTRSPAFSALSSSRSLAK